MSTKAGQFSGESQDFDFRDTCSNFAVMLAEKVAGELMSYIKIITGQVQIMAQFMRDIKVEWPSALTNLMASLGFLNLDVVSISP